MNGHRDEKALNAIFAGVLAERLPEWATVLAERAGQLRSSGAQPDLIVGLPGRERVLVENKYAATDPKILNAQCSRRIGKVWAEDGNPVKCVIGMRSPNNLDSIPETHVAEALRSTDFQWAMWEGDNATRFPVSGWFSGGVAELSAFIVRSSVQAGSAPALVEMVKDRLSDAAEAAVSATGVEEKLGDVLGQKPGVQTTRMAMAVMLNACLFQAHISQHHSSIPSPSQLLASSGFGQSAVLKAWKAILDINYWPIFGVSHQLLQQVSGPSAPKKMLELLFGTAENISADRNAPGLLGSLFGELIGDRKFLATFYTPPASAAFLAELAVSRINVDWGDSEAIGRLRIADMACGTGALLTAAYQRIAERHQVRGHDSRGIHRAMLEDVLIGCDVMSAAVHLTAARLSGEHPDVDYTATKTWVLPYGITEDQEGVKACRLGALDLLSETSQTALWGDGSLGVTAYGDAYRPTAEIGHSSLDIVIMNPPFTRPTNHEGAHAEVPVPVFAGLGNDKTAQAAMSKALKKKVGELPDPAASHGNAGIATHFIDLAHDKLKPGGVMALILPATVLQGNSWGDARDLLSEHYDDILAVSISGADGIREHGRAFSADTGMAEAVIVATKNDRAKTLSKAKRQAPGATWAVLRSPPRTPLVGASLAEAIDSRPSGTADIPEGDTQSGWQAAAPFAKDMFGHPTGVASRTLAQVAANLSKGKLALPRHKPLSLPLAPLSNLGTRGMLHRDISSSRDENRGPFKLIGLGSRAAHKTANWPILWGHDHKRETRFEVQPDKDGRVHQGMDEQALAVWNGTAGEGDACGATYLHINSDFQLNSQPLAACLTPVPALGGRAWPSFEPSADGEQQRLIYEKVLCVWLNSTFGLIARWYASNRQQVGRANLTITALGNIPALDTETLEPSTAEAICGIYDDFKHTALLPANEAYRDPARIELDDALCRHLGLPPSITGPLETVRWQWCDEPSVHGDKPTRPE